MSTLPAAGTTACVSTCRVSFSLMVNDAEGLR